jgi:hypothetical protein
VKGIKMPKRNTVETYFEDGRWKNKSNGNADSSDSFETKEEARSGRRYRTKALKALAAEDGPSLAATAKDLTDEAAPDHRAAEVLAEVGHDLTEQLSGMAAVVEGGQGKWPPGAVGRPLIPQALYL